MAGWVGVLRLVAFVPAQHYLGPDLGFNSSRHPSVHMRLVIVLFSAMLIYLILLIARREGTLPFRNGPAASDPIPTESGRAYS